MNLFINSPAYFTQQHGIIDELYIFCNEISANIDVRKYTDCIDTIGIIPIIAPIDIINNVEWKEERRISIPYRMACISLRMDYKLFLEADMEKRKMLLLNNILCSLEVIKKKLKSKFDYEQIKDDITRCVIERGLLDCGEKCRHDL